MSSNRDLQTDPSTTDLPPPYERYISELKQYRASYQSTTHSQRSSFYFKFSVGSSLTLDRSVLRAQCRNTAGEPLASKLELDEYIGTVDGRLVWGRQGFYSVCRNVRLDGFTLHAECENGLNQVVKSDLDLSRYLYVYNGGLGVKVDADMNTVFTEAPWLKFKVVTEASSDGLLKAVGEESAYKAAFETIAQTTSEHIEAEIKQEHTISAADYLQGLMDDEVKTEMTEVVADAIREQISEQVTTKIQEAFKAAQEALNTAQEAVLKACNDMVDAAASKIAVKSTESVVGPMQDQIIKKCDAHMQTTLSEVKDSAIAEFQERAELLMERSLIAASIRRAQTKAHLLEMFTAHLEEGALKYGF